MKRRIATSLLCTLALFLCGYLCLPELLPFNDPGTTAAAPGKVTQGALQALDSTGQARGACPLKHTDVQASVTGSLARVTVTQEFHNPYSDKIEAVYVFPLPQNAAVDDMTMRIGERTIKGQIKRREEARAVYEAARNAGQIASLLDQERPNIFTQAVANILPGATVKVTISYVEFLKYAEGTYEFVFPMVVGPRYIPGQPLAQPNPQAAPDTSEVPDASRITPPVTPEGTRAGHDISISVNVDTGVPLDSLKSTLHEVDIERPAPNHANVRLRNQQTIPNKDFILKFDVAGQKINDALLAHRRNAGGFFSLLLQPPERVTAKDVTPKELVFVLDTSGSMSGFPLEKAKETMRLALDALYPQDTFNLITFSGDTHILFPEPVAATRANLAKAQAFLETREGSGGTEMMKAIRAALDPSDKQDHLRIVCFITDGYVGNDFEIIGEVQKHPNARVFSFGIGSSVNRFLLDKMAEHGRGEVEYVSLQDDGSAAAKRFHERVRNPLLTDIELDWGGLPVTDVYPQRIPDLFSAKPLILTGRYTQGARGTVRLRGKLAGQPFVRELQIELPDQQPEHDVLATLWACTRIDRLMSEDFQGLQNGNAKPEVREAITQLGLDFRLLTQFTSFVAVEETMVTEGGVPRRVDVPVELPEGVSRKGLSGEVVDIDAQLKEKGRQTISVNGGISGFAGSFFDLDTAKDEKQAIMGLHERNIGNVYLPNRPATNATVATSPSPEPPHPMTKDPRHNAKLHPAIAALLVRLQTSSIQAATAELKFVHAGKAELQIHLTEKSAAVLAELQKLGVEIVLNPANSKFLIGRLPVEKLAALAELASVRYIAPQF
ncbi:MAG: VWA domain-containing protein, partial [Acidobacteria bacterium]|nr:VWA domain-containing protein [Acidobacteriota bacterium]MBI3426003.1 VWA domain-containing protein [Acidobacteriota bacterium]